VSDTIALYCSFCSFHRVPNHRREIRRQIEALSLLFDGGGDERIVFDDEELHAKQSRLAQTKVASSAIEFNTFDTRARGCCSSPACE